MASSKQSKRLCPDSDSDTDTSISNFPRFIILESLEDKQLATVNPFVVHKVISSSVNPISVKKLKNGTLLVKVDKKTYAENLLNMKFFSGIKIKTYAHSSLNSSKGVVRSSELSLCTALSVGHRICRLHPLQRGKTPPMGPPVGRGWIPLRSEDGILVVECSGSQGLALPLYNTPLWPLLGPKTRGWKWPVPINRLVMTCPKAHTFLQTYCSYINC